MRGGVYYWGQREREDKIILLSGLRTITTGNSNSHGSNDGLKLSFLLFKALKTKVDNLSMVLANNKGNLNIDGCLW